jgi:hypothetical protein
MSRRPLLILDVDGVGLPLPKQPGPAPDGYRDARAWGFDVWVPEHLPAALSELAGHFELVWCTDWERSASEHVGPLLGLPELPALERDLYGGAGWWKLRAVRQFASDRPLAWADDQMTSTARRWARDRDAPTLLIKPDRRRGISPRQLNALAGFARRI